MNILDNSTRTRTVGSTTAFATGGTTAGYALAVLAYELFGLPLSTEGVLALALVLSIIGTVLGGWAAPNKKAETEAYLGSVLAMARYGDHGKLPQPKPAEPQQVTAPADVPEGYELVDTAGTKYSDPAYGLAK